MDLNSILLAGSFLGDIGTTVYQNKNITDIIDEQSSNIAKATIQNMEYLRYKEQVDLQDSTFKYKIQNEEDFVKTMASGVNMSGSALDVLMQNERKRLASSLNTQLSYLTQRENLANQGIDNINKLLVQKSTILNNAKSEIFKNMVMTGRELLKLHNEKTILNKQLENKVITNEAQINNKLNLLNQQYFENNGDALNILNTYKDNTVKSAITDMFSYPILNNSSSNLSDYIRS